MPLVNLYNERLNETRKMTVSHQNWPNKTLNRSAVIKVKGGFELAIRHKWTFEPETCSNFSKQLFMAECL
jgi:hypothetical protein